ncbi:MAG: pilus assembly protein PilP [bacterium]|nr:MAG: pilus assembly protein PilP [bacterium]
MDLGKRTIPILLLMLAAALVASPACKKAPEPAAPLPPVAVTPKKTVPAAEQAAAPEEEKVQVFVYNPTGKRDPFGSLLRVKKADEGPPEEILTPLQRVPVTDLKVEGIILMGRKSVAHIIAPDGKAHIVSIGTPMGSHKGKVVRITSDEVIVEEQFEDYLGRDFKQETVLRLREKEGESL